MSSTTTGTAVSQSNTITVADPSGIEIGQFVIAYGFVPAGTQVRDVSDDVVLISAPVMQAMPEGTPVIFASTVTIVTARAMTFASSVNSPILVGAGVSKLAAWVGATDTFNVALTAGQITILGWDDERY